MVTPPEQPQAESVVKSAAAPSELILEIATQPPLPYIATRKVRCFLRPPAVPDAQAPLLIVVQGIGGRSLDISQKRSRLRMSQAHGAWVCAVDIYGVESMYSDLMYVDRSIRRMEKQVQEEFAHVEADMYCPVNKHWVCWNAEAERSLGGVPDDAWDWGALQAVDLLNAVRGARKRIADICGKPFVGSLHGIGQSAGVQVLLSASRFAPGLFASLLDLGGMFITSRDLEILRCLLVDPVGHLPSSNYGFFIVKLAKANCVVLRVNPTADPGERLRWPQSTLGQRLALRNMSIGWQAERLAGLRVTSVVGINDTRPGTESRAEFYQVLSAAGIAVERRDITPEDVDGVAYQAVDHGAIGDLAAAVAKNADVLSANRPYDDRLIPLVVDGARWQLVDVGHLELRHELC
ncbi:MAG: hypothetical protein AAB263_20655 [Planctomycetota bacterium]